MSITPQIGFFTKAPSGILTSISISTGETDWCVPRKKKGDYFIAWNSADRILPAYCGTAVLAWWEKIWVSDFSLLVWWTTGAPNSDKLSTQSSFKSALQTLTLGIIGGFPVSVQLAKWKTTYCKRDREYMRVFLTTLFFFFNSLLHPGAVEKWLMWTVLEYLNRAL